MDAAAAAAEDPQPAEYRVVVVTGDVRGAGSSAPAVIVLIGEDGESEPYMIGGGEEVAGDEDIGFSRATRKSYNVLSKQQLGQLRRLYVRQLPSPSAQGTGWYLDRIEVAGPGGEQWTFPCASWLGKSDAGGDDLAGGPVVERTLLPVDLASLSSFEARQFVNLNPLFAPIHVASSGVAVPHPEKVAAGLKGLNKKGYGFAGEDSYFYCSNRNGVFAMGVSDGVYAWREKGIDAGLYSQKLMEYARLSVTMGTTDVLRVVQYASKRVRRERLRGSATCCVALVDMLQGRMASANLGDSGIMVIGPRSETSAEWPVFVPPGAKLPMVVKYRSPQQEHSFGRPYQLGHHEYADSPDDAMLTTLPVGPGDVLLMGSDGLFDNVSEEEIRLEVERLVHLGAQPVAISQRLAHLAFTYSLDRDRETPYSLGASEAFDMVYSGGKADDISVVCALLQ
ncbi:hypothetical protein N2152v2_005745 [Parachlorella kessleri]